MLEFRYKEKWPGDQRDNGNSLLVRNDGGLMFEIDYGNARRVAVIMPPSQIPALLAVASGAPRPFADYHEDFGPVLWWRFPVEEAPFVGSPLDSDWPGYHTHFTPLPLTPVEP